MNTTNISQTCQTGTHLLMCGHRCASSSPCGQNCTKPQKDQAPFLCQTCHDQILDVYQHKLSNGDREGINALKDMSIEAAIVVYADCVEKHFPPQRMNIEETVECILRRQVGELYGRDCRPLVAGAQQVSVGYASQPVASGLAQGPLGSSSQSAASAPDQVLHGHASQPLIPASAQVPPDGHAPRPLPSGLAPAPYGRTSQPPATGLAQVPDRHSSQSGASAPAQVPPGRASQPAEAEPEHEHDQTGDIQSSLVVQSEPCSAQHADFEPGSSAEEPDADQMDLDVEFSGPASQSQSRQTHDTSQSSQTMPNTELESDEMNCSPNSQPDPEDLEDIVFHDLMAGHYLPGTLPFNILNGLTEPLHFPYDPLIEYPSSATLPFTSPKLTGLLSFPNGALAGQQPSTKQGTKRKYTEAEGPSPALASRNFLVPVSRKSPKHTGADFQPTQHTLVVRSRPLPAEGAKQEVELVEDKATQKTHVIGNQELRRLATRVGKAAKTDGYTGSMAKIYELFPGQVGGSRWEIRLSAQDGASRGYCGNMSRICELFPKQCGGWRWEMRA